MNNQLINFIVKKYLKFDKKNPFISISAILAFVGVAVGVMVLIITMAIMNGTAKEFENKLFTMNYPLSIYSKFENGINNELLERLEKKFPNLKFSPYISSQSIIQHDDKMSGGLIFGVDFKREAQINSIYKEAIKNLTLSKYDIITGLGISDKLYLYESSKVTMYFTALNPSGFSMMPKMKRFNYKNSFRSGLNAYDNSYMYTSVEALRTILRKNDDYYDGIHIYSNDAFNDINLIQNELRDYPGVGVIGWWQQNGNFFAAMALEKKALFVVLMLIILVASLNIISSLLMTVMSRRKEIALLLSMGATSKEVKKIFLKLGIVIGFSGILVGVFLGFSGIFILDNFNIISLPADVYGTSKLPLELDMIDFISILIGSALIVILSSYYPASKATKIDVIDVLRNE
ncbi:ABC transporter permease [Arcobacter sp.]|uniref:ABC transporter permease n=1 Tax=Arcobacter sp. TaxID=1872629 RepID=UPI003D0CFC67